MGSCPPPPTLSGGAGPVQYERMYIVYRYSRTGIFGNGGAGPGLEDESWPRARSFFGGSETADLARDRRRLSWKVLGNGGAGPGLGDGGADSGPGDGGSLPEPGDGGSLPGLGDGEAG